MILRAALLALLCFAASAHAQAPSITLPAVVEGTQVQPSYPDSARRLGIQGTTTLRLHVLANGQLGEIVVEQSAGHPDLDQAAIDAVRRWRFEPARRGKDPIAVSVRIPVKFTLGVREEPTPDPARAIRAGVITTVEGDVVVRRVSLPHPVPLTVNDDVFVQDTIATGEATRSAMVLGGRIDVVLRERSAMTITEIAGRSSLDLDTGQLTLAVGGDRLRQDEAIEIRTTNAVVTVRGEARVRVAAVPSPPGTRDGVTHVDVLVGSVSVTSNVDFRNQLLYRGVQSSSIDVRADQGITITGEVLGAIRPRSGN